MIKTRTDFYLTRIKRRITVLLFLVSIPIFYTSAQVHNVERNIFSIHAGYSDLFNGTDGLTSSDHQYNKTLSKGFSWDLQYTHRIGKKFGIGGLYSQYRSQGTHSEGKDRVSTHYLAPQINLFIIDENRFYAKLASGIGAVLYRNKGEVFGKSRLTSGFDLGVNLGVTTGFRLDNHWNIEAELNYFGCSLNKIVSSYHDEVYTIKFPQNKTLDVSRLSLSLGLSYAF